MLSGGQEAVQLGCATKSVNRRYRKQEVVEGLQAEEGLGFQLKSIGVGNNEPAGILAKTNLSL